MTYEPSSRRVDIQVDPMRADAWRAPPYYQQIKRIAENALRGDGYLIVWQGEDAIAVLPDREVKLGRVTSEVVVVKRSQAENGVRYDVALMEPDDPRRTEMLGATSGDVEPARPPG